jgi:hypothetical protein
LLEPHNPRKIAAGLQYEGENSRIKPSPSVGLLKPGAA